MRSSMKVKGSLASKALAVAAGFLMTVSFVGKAAADPIPGTEIVGYFDFDEPTTDNGTGDGDNVVRIVNDTSKEMCALIYVFDDDEEMGACCGCVLSPNKLISLSVERDLTSSWREASMDQESGVVYAFSSAPNNRQCLLSNGKRNYACNSGCDPSLGFQPPTTPIPHINGNITRVQRIGEVASITETDMTNVGDDDSQEHALASQCSNIVNHGSGLGICQCPESD